MGLVSCVRQFDLAFSTVKIETKKHLGNQDLSCSVSGANNLTLTSCPLLFDRPGVELGPGAAADLFPGGGRSLRVRLLRARRSPDLGSTTDGLQEQRHGDLRSRHPRSQCVEVDGVCVCRFPPARSATNTAGSRAREFSVSRHSARPPSRAPAAEPRRPVQGRLAGSYIVAAILCDTIIVLVLSSSTSGTSCRSNRNLRVTVSASNIVIKLCITTIM